MTILQARKTMPTATAAAISREPDGTGFRVCVSLLEAAPPGGGADPGALDAAGEVVAVFVAQQVGNDLARTFGDKDVVILR